MIRLKKFAFGDIMKKKRGFQSEITAECLGVNLFCLYIFISYMAHDIFLPNSLVQYALYLFLLYSAVFIITRKTMVLTAVSRWQIVFMLISIISMIYSTENHILSGTYYLLIVNFIIILFLSQYKIDLSEIKKICWTYAIASFFLVVLLIVTGNMNDSTGRLGNDFLGNANKLARMLMTSVLYAVWLLLFQTEKKWQKALLTLTIVVNYYAMFLSGGRKFIIVPIIFIYVLLLFKQDVRGRKHIFKYTIIVAVITILLFYLIMTVPTFYDVIGVRMESLLNLIIGDGVNADGSARIRDLMIDMALEKWLESPIWGYGHDSFKNYNFTITGYRMYSHNNFAELLYNLGLIGFIAYYYIYAKILLKAWSSRSKIPQYARAFSIAAIVSSLVYEYGAVSYSSTINYIMLFVSYCAMNLPNDTNLCKQE